MTTPSSPADVNARLRHLIRSILYRLLAEMSERPVIPVTASVDEGGLLLTLVVAPATALRPDRPRPLSPCQHDIIRLLKEVAPRRLTIPKVLEELERREWLHGESTVRKSLAYLHKRGIIENVKRRGFTVPATGQQGDLFNNG